MARTEIRIAGFGGQGVVLAGVILGRAATIYGNMHATHAQSFGVEARGGAVRSEVIISDQPIDYPRVISGNNDIFVAMSQAALNRYIGDIKPRGVLIYDPDLILEMPGKKAGVECYKVPATAMAHKLGRKLVANMIMLGALAKLTNVLPLDAVRKAICDSVPKGTEQLNLDAIDAGVTYAEGMTAEE